MRVIQVNRNFNGCADASFILNDNEFEKLFSNVNKDYSLIGDCIVFRSEEDRQQALYKNKSEYKVIFNPPATILFVNGKKYVSKAHNEEFDAEKGLLMCLAKANGISHLDLKRMLKGATYQKTATGGAVDNFIFHIMGDNFNYTEIRKGLIATTGEPKKKKGRPKKVK